jgi:hypothetical protein
MCRALITKAALTAATPAVPVPSSVIRVSWAAPAKMIGAELHPMRFPIPDSVIASATTRANGMAETTRGMASVKARRRSDLSTVCEIEMIVSGYVVG